MQMSSAQIEFENVDFKFEVDVNERQQPVSYEVANLSIEKRRRYERT